MCHGRPRARRSGRNSISGLIYEETRGVLKVFLENVIRDAVTYTAHARRKTVTAMDVVHALKRQGRTLYGFGGPSGAWSRTRTPEEAENEAVEKQARRLAFKAHQRGQPIPTNSAHRAQARQQVQSRPAARPPTDFEVQYKGQNVKVVPVGRVFDYEDDGRGGHRLVRGADGSLYDRIGASEAGLCDPTTGVSISQSLKPSKDGGGLVYQAGCKLLVCTDGGAVKGVAIICTYEIGEGLIPKGFGAPADAFARAQAGTPILMLELICARGDETASGNANHTAALALIQCMKLYATAQSYGFVVLKAENVRSRTFMQRRGFKTLFQRGAQATMQAAMDEITV